MGSKPAFSTDLGPRPALRWIPVRLLREDHNYQRDANMTRVRKMCRDFRWRDFQPLTVCADGGDGFWVIDGQHRRLAAELHPAVTEVPCYVVAAPETTDQAGSFVTINKDRAAVTPVDLYWAGVAAGDVDAVAVKALLDKIGLEVLQQVSQVNRPMTTVAIAAIRRAFKRWGAKALRQALETVAAAHGQTVGAFSNTMITALAQIYGAHPGTDQGHLTAILAKTDIVELRRDALAFKKIMGGQTEGAVRATLIRLYNKALRGADKRRIPEAKP